MDQFVEVDQVVFIGKDRTHQMDDAIAFGTTVFAEVTLFLGPLEKDVHQFVAFILISLKEIGLGSPERVR